MECAQPSASCDREYLEMFNDRLSRMRVPFAGSIDLTQRCNLRCVHCYVGPHEEWERSKAGEMDTERILSVIDEITDAGCLHLLVTGGEPLLREDFVHLYRYMKLKGLLVTVFTNGTLITDRIIEVFRTFPPQAVEVSLYGATPATYERITGIPGSYEKCVAGIRRLLENGIPVKLKTILMTLNRHEFFAIEDMARKFGVRFRFDAALFPRLNGDRAPLELRVPVEEATEKEFSDNERLNDWRDFVGRYTGSSSPATIYHCAAGLTSFHIDSYGNLRPCLMTTGHAHNLADGGFLKGWNDPILHFRQRKASASHGCRTCDNRIVCGFCPAFFELENGSEEVPSGYLCAIGAERSRKIHSLEKV